MKAPRLTSLAFDGLGLALTHAESVVYPDLDTHAEDVKPLEAADRWYKAMAEYRRYREGGAK